MQIKHTLGPWHVSSSDSDHSIYILNKTQTLICLVRDCECAWGNATLISAAPELLEALKDACEWLDSCPLGEEPRKAILRYRAVIAKAEGQ